MTELLLHVIVPVVLAETFGTVVLVVTKVVAILLHPLGSVAVREYMPGTLTTQFCDGDVNAEGPAHEYVIAPFAVKVDVCPEQILVGLATIVIVGFGDILIVTVVVPEHAPLVPVSVYVVVTEGLALTLAPVVALNPVAGPQLYVVAP